MCALQNTPDRIIIVNIDGLRADVFHQSLNAGLLQQISRIFAGKLNSAAVHIDAISTFPSITFCSQSSIFTGLRPNQHGILGNQFFDRFGTRTGGVPEFFAHDLGGTYEIEDAVNVFIGKGRINRLLPKHLPTIYETAGNAGLESLVANHMIARGAKRWIKPRVVDMARLTSTNDIVKMSAADFDRKMVDRVLRHIKKHGLPGLVTLYFLGLDHQSHHHGVQIQPEYLRNVIDPLIGRFIDCLEDMNALNNLLVIFVSDHGQQNVIEDDRHSLRLSFPFDREMAYLFDALSLDVHDFPGEDPNCDAVVASNGGMAQVYLRHREGSWNQPPRYTEDVLPVAQAFWEANLIGRYAPDLQGSLAAILVRNTEADGWHAAYQVYSPAQMMSFKDFLTTHPEINQLEGEQRLADLTSPLSGDLILFSNMHEGYYFGSPVKATHGGIHPGESLSVFSFALLGEGKKCQKELDAEIEQVLEGLFKQNKRGFVSVADIFPVIRELMGWSGGT